MSGFDRFQVSFEALQTAQEVQLIVDPQLHVLQSFYDKRQPSHLQ